MKTHIRLKQHKIRLQNTKQLEPQQKYRLGTILKTFEVLVLISPPPPRHRNLTYTNVTLPKCALLVPIFTQM